MSAIAQQLSSSLVLKSFKYSRCVADTSYCTTRLSVLEHVRIPNKHSYKPENKVAGIPIAILFPFRLIIEDLEFMKKVFIIHFETSTFFLDYVRYFKTI